MQLLYEYNDDYDDIYSLDVYDNMYMNTHNFTMCV